MFGVQVNGVPKLAALNISLSPSEETTVGVSSSFLSGVKYEFNDYNDWEQIQIISLNNRICKKISRVYLWML